MLTFAQGIALLVLSRTTPTLPSCRWAPLVFTVLLGPAVLHEKCPQSTCFTWIRTQMSFLVNCQVWRLRDVVVHELQKKTSLDTNYGLNWKVSICLKKVCNSNCQNQNPGVCDYRFLHRMFFNWYLNVMNVNLLVKKMWYMCIFWKSKICADLKKFF
jgi:hypothetical protein